MQIWIDSPGQWVGTSPSINACIQKAYTSAGGGGFSIIASGRFSRRALGGWGTLFKTFDAPAPATLQGYMGIYTVAQNGFYMGPDNSVGTQCCVQLQSDGTLVIRRGGPGGTAIGQTTFACNMGSGYYIEFSFLIADSGGWAEVRVNNDVKLTVTGADTQAQTAATWNGCEWFTYNEIADLYVNDSSGTLNNGYRGDTRVDMHLPNAAGDASEWTPYSGANYTNVDEAQASDTDYNTSDAVGETDLYNLEAFKAPGGLISGISLWPRLGKVDSGAGGVRGVLKIGSTEYEHAETKYPSATSYLYFPIQYDGSPASGSPADAFTESEFNAMQAGVVRVE